MPVTLHQDPLPLRVDETGTIRIGSSRITLDVLLADCRKGWSPEEIVRQLDTLNLADVYGAIAYYHRHRDEIDQYLQQREVEADALRQQIESGQPDRANLKAKLVDRMAQRKAGHAPTAQ